MAALGMEYNWDPESKFVRAALADKHLRFNYDVKVLPGGWKSLSREGGLDQWENKWSVITDSTAAQILESVNNTIAGNKTYGPPQVKWTKANGQAHQSSSRSLWQFTDDKGAVWNGSVQVEPVAGQRNHFLLTVKIARNNSGANGL